MSNSSKFFIVISVLWNPVKLKYKMDSLLSSVASVYALLHLATFMFLRHPGFNLCFYSMHGFTRLNMCSEPSLTMYNQDSRNDVPLDE